MNRIPVIRFRQYVRIQNNKLCILSLLPYSQIDLAYREFFENVKESGRDGATLEFVSKYERNILLLF